MKRILLLSIFFSSVAFSQNKVDRDYFINLLKDSLYGRVFNEAMALRKNKEYGKCPIIDYFIAKSFCLDNYPIKGKEWLNHILQHYSLSESNRKFIEDETKSCEPIAFDSPNVFAIYNIPLPSAGVTSSLKNKPVYHCDSKDRKIEFGNKYSEADFEKRLFELDKKEEDVAMIRSLLTDEYDVNSRDRYVLVSLKSEKITQAQVLDIATSLEKAYTFYAKYFNLRAPDKMITVYLLPDEASLYKTAKLVHDAKLPGNIYGYSLLTDLSLLGIAVPDPRYLGTLYHELFHLVVRTDVGDVPAWLDEGLASLYSTSHWKDDILFGDTDTWRVDQLKHEYLSLTSQAVPSLAQLFSYNWQQFNGGEDLNLCQAAINYALSNCLMIYFQQQDKLQNIMDAFKNRGDPGDKDSPPAPDDTQVLQSALGYSIDTLQRQFTQWFINTYFFNVYLPGGDNPIGGDELTRNSDMDAYKNSIRRKLDDLKTKNVPAEAGVAEFEKRLSSIYNSYISIDKKRQGELDKWNKKHRIKNKDSDPGGVRQMAPQEYTYPPPEGAAKEKIEAYTKELDIQKDKMIQLYIEVTETTDKYLRHATKKR